MIRFKLFLESTYKAQDGESEILHHTSPHNFNEFKPFSHFGTKQAAGARAISIDNHKPTIYSVRLKMGNVAKIDDPIGDEDYSKDENGELDTAKGYVDNLHRNGHLSSEEHNNLHQTLDLIDNKDQQFNHLAKHLNDKGIHTLQYCNGVEDRCFYSYITTHANQVRILKKKENAKLNTTMVDGSSKKYPLEFQGMTPVRNWGKEFK